MLLANRGCNSSVWLVWAVCSFSPALVTAADDSLPVQAHSFLKKYCYQCHGVNDEVGNGFHVLKRESLVAIPGGLRKPYVTPGFPTDSLLWKKVVDEGSMPPPEAPADTFPQPSRAERDVLREWIKAGAEFPTADTRQFVEQKTLLQAIVKDLEGLPAADRENRRYFSLATLHNNRETTDDQLKLLSAAISKLLNSLSWRPEIVVPTILGPENTLLAIDLSKYGWTHDEHWLPISSKYPYGIAFPDDPEWEQLQARAREYTGATFPLVRGDWFVATISRFPMYDKMLGLPARIEELESRLGIDYADSFSQNKFVRAGVIASQVSRNNRVVERHATQHGSYWRSFDFATSDKKGNILQFPLGPEFEGNPFADEILDKAFVHAGGEVIFSLPNGLQAYMLVDKDGKQLQGLAPISIVRDLRESGGTPEIVNGLSCISCHSHGIKPVQDVVRNSRAVAGTALAKVRQLYAEQPLLDRVVTEDQQRFQAAVTKATGEFLQAGVANQPSVFDTEEAVGAITRLFAQEVSLTAAAAELDFSDVKQLEAAIANNPDLRGLGLGILLNSKSIKRELWELPDLQSNSLFQDINIKLQRLVDRQL